MRLLEGALGIHEQALSIRARRLEVLARNIANADTPNYKARDLDFKALLAQAQGPQDLATTHAGHVGSAEPPGEDGLRWRVPLNPSLDGNTVEISVEQAQYGQAASQYQATLSFLENRIGGLRKALRGE